MSTEGHQGGPGSGGAAGLPTSRAVLRVPGWLPLVPLVGVGRALGAGVLDLLLSLPAPLAPGRGDGVAERGWRGLRGPRFRSGARGAADRTDCLGPQG